VNQKYGFQIEYPFNWFSVTLDPNTAKQFRIYQNDPVILLLYPEEEILNSNGTEYSLMNAITASVTKGGQKDLKRYYDYFNNPTNLMKISSTSLNEVKPTFKVLNGNNTSINGYPAFEFIIKSQKNNTLAHFTGPIRYEYWITFSIKEQEYTFTFSTEQFKFERDLPIVKKIISSFEPFNKDITKQKHELIDKKSDIIKIRDIMADKTLKNLIWKEYTDSISNFTLLYPYIDNTNNPITFNMPNDSTLTPFLLPQIHFLDLPYLDGSFSIESSTTQNGFLPEKNLFNYKLLNSTSGNFLNGSLTFVKEHSFLLPFIFQNSYQKDAITFLDNGRILKLSMNVPYQDRIVYEPIFDKIISSFKLVE
jgi:hypothetical protein